MISEDIYTIGYLVVNQLLKQGGATNTRANSNDVSMNMVQSNGVALKDSVTDLTIAVSSLTGELTTLREKFAQLEMRLCHEPCCTDSDGPAAQQIDAVIVTTAETHEQSTNYAGTESDGPAAQQVDAVIVTKAETHEQSTNYTGTDSDGPAAQQVDAVIVTTAETHEQSTNYTGTESDGPATQQVDAVIVTTAETHEQSTNYTVTD